VGIQALEVVGNQNPQVSLVLQLLHIQLSKPGRHKHTHTYTQEMSFLNRVAGLSLKDRKLRKFGHLIRRPCGPF